MACIDVDKGHKGLSLLHAYFMQDLPLFGFYAPHAYCEGRKSGIDLGDVLGGFVVFSTGPLFLNVLSFLLSVDISRGVL